MREGRPPQYATPCKLTFDLLTLKAVSESHVTWATSVPILVFLGLSVLDRGPMYATDRRQTSRQTSDAHHRLMPPTSGRGHKKECTRPKCRHSCGLCGSARPFQITSLPACSIDMFDSLTLTFDLSVPKALRQLVRTRSRSTPSAVSLASFAVELKYGHAHTHTNIKLE